MLDRIKIFVLISVISTPLVVCVGVGIENEPSISNSNGNPGSLNNQAGVHGVSNVIEMPNQSNTAVHQQDSMPNPAKKVNAIQEPIQSKADQNNLSINRVNNGNNALNETKASNATISTTEKNTNSTKIVKHIPHKIDLVESGALRRGFYVFLGLSVIVILYFLFRSYGLRHGSQPSSKVRKYGILAQRSDMEMRPLELDEEDDDTLFEINNQSPRH